jgi:trk system potassium uptake protein TrkA
MKSQSGPAVARTEQDFAVVGLSQFGASLARRLEALGYSVLGIDIDQKRAKAAAGDLTETLILDASNDEALEEADIGSYHTVIVAIANAFEASALVTAALKNRGIAEVICRASDHRHRDILLQIGADRVVLPLEESGLRLADELAAPGITSAMPLGARHSLCQVELSKDTGLKRIEDCEANDVAILVVMRDEELILTPEPSYALETGDVLVVMGQARPVVRFASLV